MGYKELIKQMSLLEKCAILSGDTVFTTRAYPRRNIPAINLSDGPNGVRKQAGAADHLGLNPSVPATCFPTAVTVACSWDPALGEESRQGHGGGSRRAGGRRAAGPGPQHQAQPALRPRLRVFLRGPVPLPARWPQAMCGASNPTASPPAPSTLPSTARSCAAWRRTPCWTNAPCGRST